MTVSRWRIAIAALAVLAIAASAFVILHDKTAGASDVELLSQGRAVTTSSVESTKLTGERAVDGDTRTRWASAAGHDPEWISVDVGSSVTVTRLVLTWEKAYARGYLVEVSDDARNWRQVYATDRGDGHTDDLSVKGSGRYLRVYGIKRATGWGYSLWEAPGLRPARHRWHAERRPSAQPECLAGRWSLTRREPHSRCLAGHRPDRYRHDPTRSGRLAAGVVRRVRRPRRYPARPIEVDLRPGRRARVGQPGVGVLHRPAGERLARRTGLAGRHRAPGEATRDGQLSVRHL